MGDRRTAGELKADGRGVHGPPRESSDNLERRTDSNERWMRGERGGEESAESLVAE